MSHYFSFRKILRFLLVLLLILLCCATVSRRALETEPRTVFSAELSSFGEALDLSRTPLSDGSIRITPYGESPRIGYTAPAGGDRITLHFSEPVKTAVRFVYGTDGHFHHDNTSPAILSEDGLSATVYLPADASYNNFGIYFGEEACTLKALTHEDTLSAEAAYAWNPIATAALLLLLCLLILLEKKLHTFAAIRDLIKKELALTRSLPRLRRVLHLCCMGVLAAFSLLVLFDLLLSIVAPAYSYTLTVFGVLAVAAWLYDLFYIRGQIRMALAFFGVVLILGLVFALSLPPTGVLSWDDEYHFSFISGGNAILTGNFSLGEDVLTSQRLRTPVFIDNPDGYMATLLHLSETEITPPFLASFSLSSLLSSIHPLLLVLLLPFALLYFAFSYAVYLPALLVYALFSLFGADILFCITLAKLAICGVYAAAFAFAIRRLKYGKRLFAVAALLPTSLFLSVSFSADSFITAGIALGFAYFIGELQRKDELITKKNAAIMLGATVLGCGPKAIYFILLVPFLFLPRRKFGSKERARKYKLVFLLAMGAVFLSFALPFLINPASRTDLRGGSDVSAMGQIGFILSHPFDFAEILFTFLGGYLAFPSVIANTSFFAYLGAGDAFFSTLFWLLLLFFAFTDRPRDGVLDLSHRPLHRLTSLGTLFVAVVLVATSLYVGFTPVGHETVLGCQFRYLFPLIPIFLYFLGSVRVRSFMNERISAVLALGGAAWINFIVFDELLLERFV